MKRLLAGLILVQLLLTGTSGAEPPAVSGRKALDLLLAASYDRFGALLTPEARALLTPDFLQHRVGGEIAGFGKLETVGDPVLSRAGTADVVTFPTKFSGATIDIQLTVTETGQIAGLHFRPPGQAPPPSWKRPSYSNPTLFDEQAVTVGADPAGNDPWKLGGVLALPKGTGPFAGVVLVHGPGPNDRDESMFANRIFADLAEGLASRGIAVLRYDKRTKVYGSQMSEMSFTLQQETVEDAVRAIALLRARKDIDPRRIYVLGHSLGGYATPRIIAQSRANHVPVAGAVILAGNARPIEEIGIAQTENMLRIRGNITPDEQRRLDAMKAEADQVRHLTPVGPNPPVLLGLPAAYFLDLQGYDPAAEARKLAVPFLFLQGERDFQVTMADFSRWKAGLADSQLATFRTYPALNHLFIAGEGPGTPAEYRTAGNVAAVVIDDISNWLSALKH